MLTEYDINYINNNVKTPETWTWLQFAHQNISEDVYSYLVTKLISSIMGKN